MIYIYIHGFLFFSQIVEDDQIPRKFYNRLDNSEGILNYYDLIAYPSVRNVLDHEVNKTILDKLARNIKLIISEYSGNHVKRCRDINYWMDEKINEQANTPPQKELKRYCITVFNDVKWNKGKGPLVCGRTENPYSTEYAKLKKELDDYCEIRDNNRCNVLIDKNKCLKYNAYIKEKKQYFTSEMQDKCRATSGCSLKDYKSGDKCTLNKMDDTFREINCDALYKEAEIEIPAPNIKERSPLEIGFFIIVTFILFYLFILFLEKVK
ncbi:hypothetical protein PVMG_04874 [Plasmodium vivax Mauritania I]|uniref:Uncharacterized protein n=2 Tax=Plasmodium vivax TaxID=5855 RepID=A0A0J9T8Y2_PLAVI|nr:hypothetical protein PVBG_00622 [Plasmodium vivax Brazil I]KMZ91102.1 hypothetical protein PVMG_04874 [Plasmodium vivax Mauritania I]